MVTLVAWLIAIAAATATAVVVWFLTAVARARRIALEQLGSRDLADLFIFLDGVELARIVSLLLLLLPVSLYLLTRSAALAVILSAAVLAGPFVWLRTVRRRRAQKMARSLPDAVLALAGALRAGAGLVIGLTTLPRFLQRPLADEFALLARQLRMGVAFNVAVRQWSTRVGTHESRALASLLTVVQAQGGAMAPALEQLAEAGRRRIAMEDRIQALTAQGRMQGAVVTLLPLAVAAVLWRLDPEAMRPLISSTRGWTVCGIVLMLLTAGWWAIRRITDIRV